MAVIEDDETAPLRNQEFLMFEVENKLRDECQVIMDPIVRNQNSISGLLKAIDVTLQSLKTDIDKNATNVKVLQVEMGHQKTLNKKQKILNTTKNNDIGTHNNIDWYR
jgi:hypothetical protein